MAKAADGNLVQGEGAAPAEPSVAMRYGMAVLAVAFVTVVRWPLQPWLGDGVPFLLFFPAIMGSAWFGGFGPGVLATALSAVSAQYFFIPPVFSLEVGSPGSAWQILFLIVGVFISYLNEALHQARRRAEAATRVLQRQQEELRRAELDQATSAADNARLYGETQEALEAAEAASRSKDEFLATVSHELRTPLNAMMGWAQLLQIGIADPEKRERGLAVIASNAKLQAQLIDDLLDVSRIVSGKMRLNVRSVDLAPVVAAAVEAIRPAAEARQITLRRVLDPRAGLVAGDSDRLQQVVWNLLSNAVKFTPRGGTVEVRLERVSSHLEVIVADSGTGIRPEFLPHVFERFRQQDSSSTRLQGGLGLGLSIVRHLTELHGGTVHVQSAGEGQGSTFVVSLPLSIAHLDESGAGRTHPRVSLESPPADEPSLDLRGIRVLVVEDEPDARETLVQILASCQAEVRAAGSAAEGLAALQQFRPDVLLSDLGMPDEDGYDLIRQVRGLPPERGGRTPAVALTAFARSEDRRRTLLAGFQMHLAKPVDVHDLAAVVLSLARGARGERGERT